MAKIIAERMTAQIEDEVVVFLIGMRINRVWKLHKWLPVARAMPRCFVNLAPTRIPASWDSISGSAIRQSRFSIGAPLWIWSATRPIRGTRIVRRGPTLIAPSQAMGM